MLRTGEPLGLVFLNTSVLALASTDEGERLELANDTGGVNVGLGFGGAANLVACHDGSNQFIGNCVVEESLQVI